jgi:hypothetical protein
VTYYLTLYCQSFLSGWCVCGYLSTFQQGNTLLSLMIGNSSYEIIHKAMTFIMVNWGKGGGGSSGQSVCSTDL